MTSHGFRLACGRGLGGGVRKEVVQVICWESGLTASSSFLWWRRPMVSCDSGVGQLAELRPWSKTKLPVPTAISNVSSLHCRDSRRWQYSVSWQPYPDLWLGTSYTSLCMGLMRTLCATVQLETLEDLSYEGRTQEVGEVMARNLWRPPCAAHFIDPSWIHSYLPRF